MRDTGIRWLCAIAVVLSVLPQIAHGAGDAPAEPDGYRMDRFRSPVPATLAGARAVSTDEARQIWHEKAALFIDVLPRPPKPENLPEGTVWRDKPRDNIPGSIWLPNVGYGRLHETTDRYFRNNLEKHTGGDRTRALLIYCLQDCWMSWNAAKRALGYGYTHILWYPDGTDGWEFEDLPLERREPEPE